MVVDKHALFESTKALWPRAVDISALHGIYRANEDSFPADDDWRQLAMWSFHQALSEMKMRAIADGASKICPQAMEFATFDRWMRSNLHGDECWVAERAIWDASSKNPDSRA